MRSCRLALVPLPPTSQRDRHGPSEQPAVRSGSGLRHKGRCARAFRARGLQRRRPPWCAAQSPPSPDGLRRHRAVTLPSLRPPRRRARPRREAPLSRRGGQGGTTRRAAAGWAGAQGRGAQKSCAPKGGGAGRSKKVGGALHIRNGIRSEQHASLRESNYGLLTWNLKYRSLKQRTCVEDE